MMNGEAAMLTIDPVEGGITSSDVSDSDMNSPTSPEATMTNVQHSPEITDEPTVNSDVTANSPSSKEISAEQDQATVVVDGRDGTAQTGDFLPPDDELSAAIVTQVEYYFSDENLPKDKFLLQQVSRDKRGFVSLSLITSFKRMKKLTKDCRVVAFALQRSEKLEVNKPGTKVRRIAPLPRHDSGDAASRTVVGVNLSRTTVNDITEQFAPCGNIVQVRVINRGNLVPGDARRHLRRGLDMSGKAETDIALVEYENQESARVACEKLTDPSDWRHGLHVSLLVPVTSDRKPAAKTPGESKTKPVDSKSGAVKNTPDEKHLEVPADETGDGGEAKVKKKKKKKRQSRVNELLLGESPGCSSSGSDTEGRDKSSENYRASQSKSSRGNSLGSPNDSPKVGRRSAGHGKSPLLDDTEWRTRAGSTGAIDGRVHGPWVQRRLQAIQAQPGGTGSSLTDLSTGDAAPVKKTAMVTVIRQPRGPDGTKGFLSVR